MRTPCGFFVVASMLLVAASAQAQHHGRHGHHGHHGHHGRHGRHGHDREDSNSPTPTIDQAEEARERGDHPAALVLAEAVARQGMTPAVQLFIAQEQRALGRHADALASAEACVEALGRDRRVRHRRRLLESCAELAAEERPRAASARTEGPTTAAVAVVQPPASTPAPAPVDVVPAPVVVEAPPPPPPPTLAPTPAVPIAPEVRDAPSETEPSRFAVEIGGGLGVGLILGNPQVVTASSGFYAEGTYSLTNSGAALRACRAGFQCPAVTGVTASPAGVLAVSLRWSPLRDALGRRFALGLSLRWQPDAADGDAFNALVLGARLYVVLTSQGFARQGLTLAALGGVGYGDIQSTPAGDGSGLAVAHVASGPVDLSAGLRAELGFTRYLHAAVEVTGHVLVPAQSAAVDVVGLVGAHY